MLTLQETVKELPSMLELMGVHPRVVVIRPASPLDQELIPSVELSTGDNLLYLPLKVSLDQDWRGSGSRHFDRSDVWLDERDVKCRVEMPRIRKF